MVMVDASSSAASALTIEPRIATQTHGNRPVRSTVVAISQTLVIRGVQLGWQLVPDELVGATTHVVPLVDPDHVRVRADAADQAATVRRACARVVVCAGLELHDAEAALIGSPRTKCLTNRTAMRHVSTTTSFGTRSNPRDQARSGANSA